MLDRNKIREIIEKLNEISKDYKHFEIALLIFLRADLYQLDNYVNDDDLEKLEDLLMYVSSIFDIEKDDIDNILYSCDEDEGE